jgi:hypothetical protein
MKDRWRGFLKSLREGRIDHLADHSILSYIEHISAAVHEEERARLRIYAPHEGDFRPPHRELRRAA